MSNREVLPIPDGWPGQEEIKPIFDDLNLAIKHPAQSREVDISPNLSGTMIVHTIKLDGAEAQQVLEDTDATGITVKVYDPPELIAYREHHIQVKCGLGFPFPPEESKAQLVRRYGLYREIARETIERFSLLKRPLEIDYPMSEWTVNGPDDEPPVRKSPPPLSEEEERLKGTLYAAETTVTVDDIAILQRIRDVLRA